MYNFFLNLYGKNRHKKYKFYFLIMYLDNVKCVYEKHSRCIQKCRMCMAKVYIKKYVFMKNLNHVFGNLNVYI